MLAAPGGQPARPGGAGGRAHLHARRRARRCGPRSRCGPTSSRKLDEELPPAAHARAWRPPTGCSACCPTRSHLRALLLDLYTEQVAGYYDPDSATLFGVAGADRAQLRLVLAHEMVHALQGQYLPLDSILQTTAQQRPADRGAGDPRGPGHARLDRRAGARARTWPATPQFWELYRDQVRQQQAAMPVFARGAAGGARGADLPLSRGGGVHALVGDRRAQGHAAVRAADAGLHRADPPSRPLRPRRPPGSAALRRPTAAWSYEDVLGENEIRVLLAALAGSDEVQTVVPIGWGGDRFRVYRTPDGPALVWYVVWDDQRAADRFLKAAGPPLNRTARPGLSRRASSRCAVDGRPGLRYVLAPAGWAGWGTLAGGLAVRWPRSALLACRSPRCRACSASAPPPASACTAPAPPARPPACR